MTAPSTASSRPTSGIIRSKVRPPDRQDRSVPRPRLNELLRGLEASFGVVWVTASPGSGKTTAVLDAVAGTDRQVAWLTLDATDRAPGRLLVYLEASLRDALPELGTPAADALANDVPHSEAAGILAEAIGAAAVTLVIDELERIHASEVACETLSAFLRYLPATAHVILISRRSVPIRLGTRRDVSGVGQITEHDLAFTVKEAADALVSFGHSGADADVAVAATGGWVAGVLFEAWRSPSHLHGLGGEADPLRSYLSSEIMGELEESQRAFLVDSSLLEDISIRRAAALGIADPAAAMDGLRDLRLPLSFSADGLTMRVHPRFREFLQDRFERSDRRHVLTLTAAYGALLTSEARHEEALDAFLAADDLARAEEIADHAVPVVLQRQDFAVVERWLGHFPQEAIERSRALTLAQLLLAIEREQWLLGASRADRLMKMQPDGPLDADVAVATASCYCQVSRLDEALAAIRRAPRIPQTEAMRFAIGVDLVDDPTHYRDRPPSSGNVAVDGMLIRHDFAHGRFAMLLDGTDQSSPTGRAHRIAALRAMGRLDEALELLQAEPTGGGWTMTRLYTELLADLDRPEEARASLREGRRAVDRSGPGFRMFELLLEASLDLRFGRDTVAARRALALVEREPTAARRRRIVEQLHLWNGLIALFEDRDDEAAEHLREAVRMMREWDRLLFLPAAATYLAEAEWRLEDEAAADAAADVALAASRRLGSDHLLLAAVRDFPAVVGRRLDAEVSSDSPWHAIGRKLMTTGGPAVGLATPRVRVVEFGQLVVQLDGEDVPMKLSKSAEILAFLAARGGRASKLELLDALFTSRSDESARSYLRQALNRLRQALPDDAPLSVEPDHVGWLEPDTLVSESTLLGHRLEHAAGLVGDTLLATLRDALAPTYAGQYLPDVRTEWVVERRRELIAQVNDAKHEAALAAFDLGRYQEADGLVHEILGAEPFRETSWRLAMRIAAALGDDDRVIARYQSCQEALASVDAEPAESTHRLLDQLRR